MRRVEIGNDDSSNLRWRQCTSVNDDKVYYRNPFNKYFKGNSQVDWNKNRVGVPLPRATADDELLFHVNHKRQHAAVINKMYFRGKQAHKAVDLNGRRDQTVVGQVNKHDTANTVD